MDKSLMDIMNMDISTMDIPQYTYIQNGYIVWILWFDQKFGNKFSGGPVAPKKLKNWEKSPLFLVNS